MATVTGYTAERMKQIENETIVNGYIVAGNLILITREGTEINAGNVIGPEGPAGPTSISIVTSSTRPTGLGAGDNGKFIYEKDTKLLFFWDGTSWVYLGGRIVCTSATRPVSPPVGLEIYETDTGRFLIRSSSGTWVITGYTKFSGRSGVSLSDTHSIPDSVVTAFTGWTELYDSDGFFSGPTNIIIPPGLSGLYAVLASCDTPTGPYDRDFLELSIGSLRLRSGSQNEDYLTISPTLFIPSGTVIGLSAYQVSGAARTWTANLELTMIHHMPD